MFTFILSLKELCFVTILQNNIHRLQKLPTADLQEEFTLFAQDHLKAVDTHYEWARSFDQHRRTKRIRLVVEVEDFVEVYTQGQWRDVTKKTRTLNYPVVRGDFYHDHFFPFARHGVLGDGIKDEDIVTIEVHVDEWADRHRPGIAQLKFFYKDNKGL